LAERSKNINLIIGGHTHTYLDTPALIKNQDQEEVWVTQVGWAGMTLGRLDIYFEQNFSERAMQCNNQAVG
jgi:5'-nucleotidase